MVRKQSIGQKHVGDELLKQAGLTSEPQPGERVHFLVRGYCMAPDFQDGDLVMATWHPTSLPAELADDEVAIFLLQHNDGGASVLLKRWYGYVGLVRTYAQLYDHTGAPTTLSPDHLYLLATNVNLAQRPGERDHDLLIGTVFAGLDLTSYVSIQEARISDEHSDIRHTRDLAGTPHSEDDPCSSSEPGVTATG